MGINSILSIEKCREYLLDEGKGGHTCRTNCANWGLSTGEYHHHRSKGVPQATEPRKSST
jgi:hypothetical protein